MYNLKIRKFYYLDCNKSKPNKSKSNKSKSNKSKPLTEYHKTIYLFFVLRSRLKLVNLLIQS